MQFWSNPERLTCFVGSPQRVDGIISVVAQLLSLFDKGAKGCGARITKASISFPLCLFAKFAELVLALGVRHTVGKPFATEVFNTELNHVLDVSENNNKTGELFIKPIWEIVFYGRNPQFPLPASFYLSI